MTENVHRVKASDLKVGEQVEKSEHPWASRSTARKIAADHLRENPKAYVSGKSHDGATREVVILNQNVRVIPPRKKKKPVEQPVSNAPGWIPQSARLWG
jgi:hypothetical protein